MTVSNESLKEYYVKLQRMYDNCYNMLTAIQQSLSTTASEITVTVADSDDAETNIRIPSFLYLENKLEQIENNFSNLFNMPDSGEAWFTKSSDMYKLNMVRSSNAPVTPVISSDQNTLWAGYTPTTLLKDLVSPHTYLHVNINNLPESATEMFMKKIVFNNAATFNAATALNMTSYDDWVSILYKYRKGEDYEEYDSTIKLPVRKDTFLSQFNIEEIIDEPWVDITNGNTTHTTYKLRLSTLEYSDAEDPSIRMSLKVGDRICLGNQMVVYIVKSIDTASNSVIIEETVGHITLQTYSENNEMQLKLYNDNYNNYKYVDVPLEENPYIVVFLGVLYNNVRSSFSDALVLNLNSIYMKDEAGNDIVDSKGNKLTYIEYYQKYCTNIGDLILGLTEAAYPQLSNYTSTQLQTLTTNPDIATTVTNTIDVENAIQVVPINKHLIDDTSTEQIINLHAQKNDIQAQLITVNDNISQIYNTLTTTDFTQQTSNTFASLQSKLTSYYTERTTLQKQLNSIIDSIAAKSTDVTISYAKTKYRIRGLLNTETLEQLIQSVGDAKTNIIAADIEYKYKSTSKDTNTVTIINSNTFTDWNKQTSIERGRSLVFDENTSSWALQFNNYDTTDNIIKWNQVDIPITPGEDVIIRVRYKYNIGQPFVDLMTPWSDDVTVVFPPEYTEDTDVTTIVKTNQNDTVVAGYRDILMNEGYEEHINNKIIAGDQVFMHQPQNIYSGFTTAENKMISLYDKLTALSQDIEQYKSWVEGESNAQFDVYLQYDDQTAKLAPNSLNVVNIYNTDHISGTFIKKNMSLVIKNTGNTRINLYSIFPGNTDVSLLRSNIDSYANEIGNYERLPLFINNQIALQNLGQWIYFRQTNPYTKADIVYNTEKQRNTDIAAKYSETPGSNWISETPQDYMLGKSKQVLHVYRDRINKDSFQLEAVNGFTSIMALLTNSITSAFESSGVLSDEKKEQINSYLEQLTIYNDQLQNTNDKIPYENWTDNDFIYKNTIWQKTDNTTNDKTYDNKYLGRYEDIFGKDQNNNKYVSLDSSTNIAQFHQTYTVSSFKAVSDYCGGFVYPDLQSREQIMTGGAANDKVFIDKGEALSIPITFEYYLDGVDGSKTDNKQSRTSVTKSLYFDIKNSLVKNPIHYMIDITGHYDFTSVGDIYSNFTNINLEDNVTNE